MNNITIGSTNINMATYTPTQRAPAEAVDLVALKAKIDLGGFPDLIGSLIKMIAGSSAEGKFDIDVSHTKATLTLGNPPVITNIELQGGQWMKTVGNNPARAIFQDLSERDQYTRLTTLFIQTFKDSRNPTEIGATSSNPSSAATTSPTAGHRHATHSSTTATASLPNTQSTSHPLSHSQTFLPGNVQQAPEHSHALAPSRPASSLARRKVTHLVSYQRKGHEIKLKKKKALQASTLRALRKKNQNLEKQKQKLDAEIATLQESLRKAEETNRSQQALLTQSQTNTGLTPIHHASQAQQTESQILQQKQRIQELETAQARLTQELTTARERLAQAEASGRAQTRTDALETHLTTVSKANNTATAQLGTASLVNESVTNQTDQQELEDFNVNFGTDVDTKDKTQEISDRLEAQMQKNFELSKELEAQKALIKQAIAEAASKEQTIRIQATDLEKLARALETANQHIPGSDQNADLVKLTKELDDLKKKHAQILQAKERLATRLNELEQFQESNDQSASIEKLRKQLKQAQEETRKANKTLNDEKATFEELLTEKENRYKSLMEQLKALQNQEAQQASQDSNAGKQDLLEAIRLASTEINRVKDELETLQKQIVDKDTLLQASLTEHQTKVEELEGQLKQAQQLTASHQKQQDGLQKELDRLTALLETKQTRKLQTAEQQTDIVPTQQALNEDTDDDIGFGRDDSDSRISAVEKALEKEKESKEAALQKAKTALETLEKQNLSIAQIKAQLEMAQKQLQEQETRLTQQTTPANLPTNLPDDEKSGLIRNNETLAESLKTTQSENKKLLEQLHMEYQTKLDESKGNIEKLSDNLKQAETNLQKQKISYEKLSNQLQEQQANDDEAASKEMALQKLGQKNRHLTQELTDKKTKIEEIERELEETKTKTTSQAQEFEANKLALETLMKFLTVTMEELKEDTDPASQKLLGTLNRNLAKATKIQG